MEVRYHRQNVHRGTTILVPPCDFEPKIFAYAPGATVVGPKYSAPLCSTCEADHGQSAKQPWRSQTAVHQVALLSNCPLLTSLWLHLR
jgi:hypothetical protein